MKKIRAGNAGESKGDDQPPQERPLLILGPSSSGSLRSLQRELKVLAPNPGLLATGEDFRLQRHHHRCRQHRPIHELGRVHDTLRFLSRERRFYPRSFSPIRVSRWLSTQAKSPHCPKEIPYTGTVCSDLKTTPKTSCDPAEVVHLRFPREISYFRAAYQDKTASQQKSEADIPVPQSAPGDAESGRNRHRRRRSASVCRCTNARDAGSRHGRHRQ